MPPLARRVFRVWAYLIALVIVAGVALYSLASAMPAPVWSQRSLPVDSVETSANIHTGPNRCQMLASVLYHDVGWTWLAIQDFPCERRLLYEQTVLRQNHTVWTSDHPRPAVDGRDPQSTYRDTLMLIKFSGVGLAVGTGGICGLAWLACVSLVALLRPLVRRPQLTNNTQQWHLLPI